MNLIFMSSERLDEVRNILLENSRMLSELKSGADNLLDAKCPSVTFHKSPAKSGDIHDYFSEGPYWWPNPENPDGPYIRRDGEFNPDRFNHHSDDMRFMAESVVVLSQAGVYTGDKRYTDKAAEFLKVWFTDEKTRMNPNLNHAQAIRGICDGRGIGIIDTAFLIKVVNGADLLKYYGGYDDIISQLKNWFSEYSQWMKTSKNGVEEMNHPNNHSNWWNTQLAAFSAFSGDDKTLEWCFDRFINHIIPSQTAYDGSFCDELERTRSYHYTVYNLEASAILCEIAWNKGVDLWNYTLPDGRGMKKCIEFFKPYYYNPFLWKHQQIAPDCLNGEVLPMKLAARRYMDDYIMSTNEFRNKNIIPCSLMSHLGISDLI